MDVITKELSAAFPGTNLNVPIEPEFEDEDDTVTFVDPHSFPLTETHRLLMLRLAPLRRVQRDLERSLGAASLEEVDQGNGNVAPWSTGSKFRPKEFSITSRSGWKSALSRVRGLKGDAASVHEEKQGRSRQVRPVHAFCDISLSFCS